MPARASAEATHRAPGREPALQAPERIATCEGRERPACAPQANLWYNDPSPPAWPSWMHLAGGRSYSGANGYRFSRPAVGTFEIDAPGKGELQMPRMVGGAAQAA
jgi:hypothetical protein